MNPTLALGITAECHCKGPRALNMRRKATFHGVHCDQLHSLLDSMAYRDVHHHTVITS